MTENFDARIEITTNGKEASQSIDEVTRSTRNLNKAIDDNTKAQKGNLKANLDVNAGWRESIARQRNFKMMIGETEQAASKSYRNVATSMDSIIAERERVGRAFSDSLQARLKDEQKFGQATQQASRGYLNESTKIDAAIAMRRKESEQFARALRERLQLEQQQINQLPRLRYALYDVANASGAVAATFGAAGIGVLKLSADYESAFTNVERTTLSSGKALELIRQQLLSLSTQVPVAFTELAGIATIGAQLGIASSDLVGFTKNVSMFSATTNVSVEEAAKSFGALGELLGVSTSEYNKLGSAISFVGVNSVATESEILSVAKNLGGVANQAGLSAEFVVGLSGALASLRVPAEQSRGALTRVFQEINRSAIEGGPKLQAFANVLGVTAEQAKNLAQTNQQAFFQQLIQGLSALDSGQLTATLDALELSDIRVTNTLTRLSKNLNVVNKSLADSSEAYASGTFLAQAYGYRVDDLASRFQIFQNSLAEVGAAFGDAINPAVGEILDSISKSLNRLADALRTDAGQALAQSTVAVFGFVSAVAAITSVVALSRASVAAFQSVVAASRWADAAIGLKGLTAALVGVGPAANAATVAVGRFTVSVSTVRTALIATGIGAIAVALGTLALAFEQTASSADDTFNRYINDTSGLADALNADIQAYKDARVAGDQELLSSYVTVQGVTEGASQDQIAYQENLKNTALVLGVDIPNAYGQTNDAIIGNTRVIGDNTTAWIRNSLITSDAFKELMNAPTFDGGLFGGLFGEAETVSDTLRRLRFDFDAFTKVVGSGGEQGGVNYFQDLANEAVKAGRITKSQFIDITRAIASGNTAFTELIRLVLGYTNAISILELPSSVKDDLQAIEDGFSGVGDGAAGAARQVRTLVDYANDLSSAFQRAIDIRWQSALAADDLVQAWEDLGQRITDARNRILGLTNTRDRLEYFLSIAIAAGDTMRINELQAELANTANELASAQDDASTELTGNSAAARRNRAALTALLNTNADYITSLAESGASLEFIRSEITRLNADFLAQGMALGYSEADLLAYSASFGDLTQILNRVPRNITVDANADPALQALNEFVAKANAASATVTITSKVNADSVAAQIRYLQSLYDGKKALYNQQLAIRNFAGAITTADAMAAYARSIKDLGGTVTYATGGYTGRGGKYEPAGIVHKGEYVVPKHLVNQSTGLPYADALGRLVSGSAPAAPSYAGGGLVSGSMMVSLSPDDRALLRGLGATGDVVVAVDSREIARANARGAKLVTAEGGYLV